MGRPVVATDHGGARETILPGVTGWLAAARDPAALAAAIGEALALDAAERGHPRAPRDAHIAAGHFSREAMCARTIDGLRGTAVPGAAGAEPGPRTRRNP